MQTGFEFSSARREPKVEDQPIQQPMAADKKIRRKPSTDQKKVRRKMQTTKQASGTEETPMHREAVSPINDDLGWLSSDEGDALSGASSDYDAGYDRGSMDAHERSAPANLSGASRDYMEGYADGYNSGAAPLDEDPALIYGGSMNREAQILNAMANATADEQAVLAAELNDIRRAKREAIANERSLDFANTVVSAVRTPVRTHERSTTGTDWLGKVAVTTEAKPEDVHRVRAQAMQWFRGLHEAVVADDFEFAEQAKGQARAVTASYDEAREPLMAAYLDTADSMRVRAGYKTANPVGDSEAGKPLSERDPIFGEEEWVNEEGEAGTVSDGGDWSPAPTPGSAEDEARQRESRLRMGDVVADNTHLGPVCVACISTMDTSIERPLTRAAVSTAACTLCGGTLATVKVADNPTEGWEDPDTNDIERYKGSPPGFETPGDEQSGNAQSGNGKDDDTWVNPLNDNRGNEPAFSEEFDGGREYKIPEGYHEGARRPRGSVRRPVTAGDGTSVEVSSLPNCDFCGQTAKYDGKTQMGPWANMCDLCFNAYGVGLGTGKGQELVAKGSRQAGYGRSYAGDPYWLTARYPGTCAKCQGPIAKGEEAFYYPRGKKLFCKSNGCGDAASRDFESASFDEMMMGGSKTAGEISYCADCGGQIAKDGGEWTHSGPGIRTHDATPAGDTESHTEGARKTADLSDWVESHRGQMKVEVIYTDGNQAFVSPDGEGGFWYDSVDEAKGEHGDVSVIRVGSSKQANQPVNVGDWSDADWAMHEMNEIANDPDVPSCDGCGGKTYDLLPSMLNPGNQICLGCAKREDRQMMGSKRQATEGTSGTCSVCGDSIERDPGNENPQTWHHNSGTKHDHEAKPSGSKESRRVTAFTNKTDVEVPAEFHPMLELLEDEGYNSFWYGEEGYPAEEDYWEAYDQGEDIAHDYWAYTKPGWWFPTMEAHTAHEPTAEDILRVIRQMEPHDCPRCTGATASRRTRRQAADGEMGGEKGETWPWELPEEGAEEAQGASDVEDVATPGQSPADYPQPNTAKARAFRARVQANVRKQVSA